MLTEKLAELNVEVSKLDKEIKSHKSSHYAFRLFHSPVDAYHKSKYGHKGAKLAFLEALDLYTKDPEKCENLLLNNYRVLCRAKGNESETGQLLNAAITLGKFPPKILRQFQEIQEKQQNKDITSMRKPA